MARPIHSTDMRLTQVLSSGIIVRQDFRTSVRSVFFDTRDGQWRYATHGGTIFVVMFRGRPYGLTCLHVPKDFDWRQLVVTDEKWGKQIAGLRSVANASHPKEAAIDTDLLDVAVIEFSDDVNAGFFDGGAYILDEKTRVTSKPGDTLHIAGALKAKSNFTEGNLAPVYCHLEVADHGPSENDPTLRRAIGKFDNSEIDDVRGLSGSPVLNVSREALCGMVVRGGIEAGVCSLWYVDMIDIVQLLAAIAEGRAETYYRKTLTKVVAAHRGSGASA